MKYIHEKKCSQIETELISAKVNNPLSEKKKETIITRQSTAKNLTEWLKASITLLRNNGNLEQAEVFKTILSKHKQFEETAQVRLKSWKGKSSMQFIEKPDSFIIITYQKPDQDSIPKEVKNELKKTYINEVINVLSDLNEGKKISTRDIGEKLHGKHWDKVFSTRKEHKNLNHCLRLLDYYGMTHYRGKFTTILKNYINIQTCLQ